MELPEEDLTRAVIERQTGVQKLHRCLPLPIFSLPCPEVAHGRRKQDPCMLNPTRGTSRRLKPTPQEEDGGRWSPLSSTGQGKLWLPARASKRLSLQYSLAAPLPPVRLARLETLWVVRVSAAGREASPKARRCRTATGAIQDGALQHTSTTGESACIWVEFGPNCMAN